MPIVGCLEVGLEGWVILPVSEEVRDGDRRSIDGLNCLGCGFGNFYQVHMELGHCLRHQGHTSRVVIGFRLLRSFVTGCRFKAWGSHDLEGAVCRGLTLHDHCSCVEPPVVDELALLAGRRCTLEQQVDLFVVCLTRSFTIFCELVEQTLELEGVGRRPDGRINQAHASDLLDAVLNPLAMEIAVHGTFLELLLPFLLGFVGKSEFFFESFLLVPMWIVVSANIFRRERFDDASERHLGWCVMS